MSKKSLARTNPHLRKAASYRAALLKNVATSTAVETGARVEDILTALTEDLAKKGLNARRPASRK